MLKSYFSSNNIEIGCDEVGRGCLSGPVVAAAVILPKNFKNKEIKDSKKLNEKLRNKLNLLIQNNALEYTYGVVENHEIDKINILNASFLAIHRALNKTETNFNSILVDGNKFLKYKNIEHHCIIKGDNEYLSIASASIIAKVYRDKIMEKLHLEYPKYLWNKNKGYPTKHHKNQIKKIGVSKYHRISFNLY